MKSIWTLELKTVYRQFPACIRSKDWHEIVHLANAGKVDEAKALARAHQDRSPQIKAENIVARRLALLRIQEFALRNKSMATIKQMFRQAAESLAERMEKNPAGTAGMRRATKLLHDTIVQLRRELQKHITDVVWKGIVMGVQHPGEALKPIFRDNAEAFQDELADIEFLEHPTTRDLMEARLTFGISSRLAKTAKPSASIRSDKWAGVTDRIYRRIVKSNNAGLTLSERIYDLTNRAELDIKRRLVTDIANGASPRELADAVVKHIYVEGVDPEFQSGPGVYKSPMANALRLSRTELGKAYTQAAAAWAKGKEWLAGVRIALSSAHNVTDDCDDIAGDKVYDADEAADLLPVHPHCMCYLVYIFKEDALTDEETGETFVTDDQQAAA